VGKKQIASYEAEWIQRKVNQALSPIDTLKDIVKILQERFFDDYNVNDVINYLECETTYPENDEAVSTFRSAIINEIPKICDAVDKLDNEIWIAILEKIINTRPKNLQHADFYAMQKLFSEKDAMYGMQLINGFTNGFAKNHVYINPSKMNVVEVRMLVKTACYLESIMQSEAT